MILWEETIWEYYQPRKASDDDDVNDGAKAIRKIYPKKIIFSQNGALDNTK